MTATSNRLVQLGLTLPPAPVPAGGYVPARRSGLLVYTSGQTPKREGKLVCQGQVGAEVSVEDAYQAARLATLSCLAALQSVIEDLDRVSAVVKVNGYVRSAPGFGDQSKVMDGASDLLKAVFGERGQHARTSIGVSELPGGAAVEVELVVGLSSTRDKDDD